MMGWTPTARSCRWEPGSPQRAERGPRPDELAALAAVVGGSGREDSAPTDQNQNRESAKSPR